MGCPALKCEDGDKGSRSHQEGADQCPASMTTSVGLLEEVLSLLGVRWTRGMVDESHAAPRLARAGGRERLSIISMTSSGRYPWWRAKATISRTLPSTALRS